MERHYEVLDDGQAVGRVTVRRNGLYWDISCSCNLPKGSMCRLSVSTEEGTLTLGLLCPKKDFFWLETKIPCKKLGQGNLRFFLKDKMRQEKCLPLDPEHGFAYLDKLEYCRFARINGTACLLLSTEK